MNKSIIAACTLLGSQSALAKALGVKPPSVSQWITGERPIPADKCVAIEQATNGAVTRKDLRPNDFWRIWPDLSKESVKEGV